MEQDGKVDQPATAQSSPDISSGKIMLTLCMRDGYRHAAIPLPSSYEAACAEALKTFAAYVPKETEAISLRQAIQRKNGKYVWSIIREDVWETILRKDGEEVGVFLPDVSPETMPYESTKRQDAQSLISFHFLDERKTSPPILKVVFSLSDCNVYADKEGKMRGWKNYELRYDKRMVGSETERKAYRIGNEEDSDSDWSGLSNDAALFHVLLGFYPEPLRIQIFNPAPPTPQRSWVAPPRNRQVQSGRLLSGIEYSPHKEAF